MQLDEIRKKYNSEGDSLEDIKRKLRSKVKEAHPDNNNDNYDKDSFEELKEDLEIIEKEIMEEKSKTEIKLTPNELLEIIQEMNDLDIYKKSNTQNELQKKFDESIQEQTVKFTKQFKVKRYSLTGLTTLITFLWMIPDKILEHPILKQLFNGEADFIFLLSFVWVIFLICTILYWVKTFKIERVEKEILEEVKIESVQNTLFMDYIEYHVKDKEVFSKKDFMDHLLWKITYKITNRNLRKMVFLSISENVIQNIANIILERAVEQRIIKKVENRSLIEHFELIKE